MNKALKPGIVYSLLVGGLLGLAGCSAKTPLPIPSPADRLGAIPADAVKMTPSEDKFLPVVHLEDWESPVLMPGGINTAGGEDSPFISPDGKRFFFFFTPDVSVPAEKQLFDGVTGIWWSQMEAQGWSEPTRVILNDDLALDGCPFARGDVLWFCSARVGNLKEIDIYTATLEQGLWGNWQNAGEQLNLEIIIGEMHISMDSQELIFHNHWQKGYPEEYSGDIDLWAIYKQGDGWGPPVNLGPQVNNAEYDGWPFLSSDGSELWFTSVSRLGYQGPAVFRSFRQTDGSWGTPVEVVSNFAGEPTLDDQGNLYFVHHYFDGEGNMIEADIYVAWRRLP